MLTIFSTGKPFRGHAGMIQRNAIRSWVEMDPGVEVILFGDEDGAAEIATEFDFRNEREVERSETGTKYLRFLFARAQEIASNDILCYVNCDIILLKSFWRAVNQVAALQEPFLMVGRRTNTDVTEPVDFGQQDWEPQIEQLARSTGEVANEWCADFFVFRRGFYKDLPPLVNGRNYWDNWLIWKAQSSGAMVVDASEVMVAVHQNHDYGYHPGGATGVMDDPQTRRNFEIGKKGRRLRTITEVSHKLTPAGIQRNWSGPVARAQRRMRPARNVFVKAVWFPLLGVTRPIRRALGLDASLKTRVTSKLRSAKEPKPHQ